MNIETFLQEHGLESSALISLVKGTILVTLATIVGWIAHVVAKKGLAGLVRKIAGKTATAWDDLLFDNRFFNRLSILVIPVAIYILAYAIDWVPGVALSRLLDAWITLSAVLVVTALLDGANRIYESYPLSRDKPIKIFIQIINIFLYCTAGIILIGIFTGKEIATLLAGMAAFAAVLMLVFKDSILGLVAGIQLSANNMIRIGDWIVMPACGADGEVLEINLATVKVQNWDMTITTIPTYRLVSDSFTNWRGMQESNGRRIKRSVNIDVRSVHHLDEKEIQLLRRSTFLREYIEKKLADLAEFNASRDNPLDARRLTNIGTFREYMESWLARNPDINLNMTHMVRQLQPGPTGIPLEIYCFSARQQWVEYERVQADIFDHLYAVMELFHLDAFQYPGNIVPVDNGQQHE
ncbi:MAG: mechanosensitive ion channel family protein [Odoribacteraceae bacterium]|jgi:miniconductance mechanosensitive channel|nr:mechanosensitive ion channel family protein [Odoribacteraceae bacterium]